MNRFSVLMYHEILGPDGFAGRPGQPVQVASGYLDVLPPPLHVHEADFAAQMEWLDRKGWHVMNLSDLHEVYEGGPNDDSRLPDRSVLITFDDLYQSLADRAVPILREYGFSALGFACADWIFDRPQERSGTHPVCLSWPELAAIGDTVTLANHSRGLHTRRDGRTAIEALVAAGDRAAFVADTLAAEAQTGRSRVYAWPFGVAPEPARDWLATAGIKLAFTTQPGSNDHLTLPLQLNRKLVPMGMDLAGFAALMHS